MCYRYSIFSKPELIELRFKAKFQKKFIPKYHTSAFSQEKLPIITNKNPKEIILADWGFIPHWVKNVKQAEDIRLKTANARSETIYEKPSFRYAAKNNHCLVIADGFFEWRAVNNFKYPYFIRLKNHKLFAMAGLWDFWINPDTDEDIITFTIITTEANPLMKIVHNQKKRMPVILTDESEKMWLDVSLDDSFVKNILTSYDEDEMEAYTISKLITSKKKDLNVSEILNPYSYPGVESRL